MAGETDLINKYTQDWKVDETGTILIPDEFLEKVALKEAALDTVFTQMGDRLTQPKHKGDKLVKRVDIPVLHEDNRIDNGINANAAEFMKNVWYAYDANGVQIGEAAGYATQALANAVAGGDDSKTKSGAGTVYYGDADYTTLKDGIPTLTEEGGNVNAVNVSSRYIHGKVRKRGIHMKWTVDSLNKDNRPGLLMTMNKELAVTVRDLREAEAQADLIAASSANIMTSYGSTNTPATIDANGTLASGTFNSGDVLTYATLEAFELALKKNRVPMDTSIIVGSTKVDTKVIDSAWYIFVPQALVPTLRKMEDAVNGVRVWTPVAKYKDASKGNTVKNEVGSIGSFRFVEVFNMQTFKGAGAVVADGAGEADEGKPTYETVVAGDRRHDAFPLLFVGSDSFATIGYEGASLGVKTAMPKADAYNDPFGEKGSIAIKYWTGFINYRPERIRQIQVVIRKGA